MSVGGSVRHFRAWQSRGIWYCMREQSLKTVRVVLTCRYEFWPTPPTLCTELFAPSASIPCIFVSCARAPWCEAISQSRSELIALRALSTFLSRFFVFRVRVRARVCVHYVRVCVPACPRGCEPVYCRRIYIFRPRRLLLGGQLKTSGWRARDGGWKPVHFLEREAGSFTVVEPRSLSKKWTVFWSVI